MGAELARVRFFVAALKSGDFSYPTATLGREPLTRSAAVIYRLR